MAKRRTAVLVAVALILTAGLAVRLAQAATYKQGSTGEEVRTIQVEGSQKRRAAEAELGRIEGELKKKLLEIQK